MKTRLIQFCALFVLAITTACAGDALEAMPCGQDGTSCSVEDNGNGTKTIFCADGTSGIISDGQDGTNGTNGSSCSVVTNANDT